MAVPFAKYLPDSIKDMYTHDFISGIYWGIYNAIVFILGPFILIKSYHFSNYLISIVISGTLLGMFFSPFISELTLHTKKKEVMTFLAIIGRGMMILVLIPFSNLGIAIIIALGEFISALTFPVYTQILKFNYTDEYRGRAMAYVRIGVSLATVLTSFLIGYLLSYNTDFAKYLFAVGGVAGVLAAIEFNKIRVIVDEKAENFKFKNLFKYMNINKIINSVIEILNKNSSFRKFILMYVLFSLSIGLINPLIPIYFNKVLKLNYNIAGIVLGVFPFIAGLITYIIWGNAVDKNSPLKLLGFSFLVNAFGLFIFPFNHSLYSAGVAIVIFSIIRVGLDILGITAVLYFCIPEDSGLFTGTYLIFAGLVGFLAPYLSIFLLSYISIEMIFYISAFIMFISALGMFTVNKSYTPASLRNNGL